MSDEQYDLVRHDVNEADALEEEEKRDRARQKCQRMFWEAIPEGGQEAFSKKAGPRNARRPQPPRAPCHVVSTAW
jgi:hypothetical protein